MMNRLLLVLFAVCCAHPSLADGVRPGDDVFETGRMWNIHIRVSGQGWEMMQPTRAPRLAVVLGINAADNAADDKPYVEGQRLEPCPFGYEYAYVRGTVELDGEAVSEVGVRFKGNSSYQYYADALKRPLKLDFNRFVKGQKFRGLETINLGNNALDSSQLRETLSYELFREAGVPAPRTAFATVYLTVEGLYDRQFIGVYTMVEEVDKDFLKTHYDTTKGLLLKPENIRNLPYLGENFADYNRYEPKTEPTPEIAGRFIDFLKLLHFADEETFQSAIDAYLATDQFLRFIAVNALIINSDSFLSGNHNYFMYVHPTDGRVYFMPWDQNFSFGMSGRNNESLSIDSPMNRPNTLIERVMLSEANREAYREHVRKLLETSFSPQRMLARIEKYETVVKLADAAAAAASTQPTTMPAGVNRPRPDLKEFVPNRVEAVLAQLAMESTGYAPGQRAPLPPPTIFPKATPARAALAPRSAARLARQTARALAVPPPPARPAPSQLPAIFVRSADANRSGTLTRQEIADTVRVFFIAAVGNRSGTLDAPAMANALDRVSILLEPTMPEQDPPTVDPADRPTMKWARLLVREASADSDDRLTLAEMHAAAERWFTDADTDRDGSLSANEVQTFIGALTP